VIRTLAEVVALLSGLGLLAVVGLTTAACFEPGPLLSRIMSVGVSLLALLIISSGVLVFG